MLTGGGGADDLRGAPGGTVLTPVNPNPALTPPAPLSAPFSFIFGSVKLPEQPVTLHGGHIALTIGAPMGVDVRAAVA